MTQVSDQPRQALEDRRSPRISGQTLSVATWPFSVTWAERTGKNVLTTPIGRLAYPGGIVSTNGSMNLLARLRRERGLTYVLVSRNLAIVAHLCERLLVMNAGRVVEELTAEQLRAAMPTEPYTRQLLQASLGDERQAAAQLTTFD